MNFKLSVRNLVQNLLAAFPASIHCYLLSCYHNVPKLSLGSGYQVLQNMFVANSDSLSSSNAYFKRNRLFHRILEDSAAPVIFDIGANIGQTSSAYASIIPQARIYAFEPFLENFGRTVENTQSLQNVSSHQLAMSNRNGQMQVRRDHHPLSQWNSISSSYQEKLAERGQFSMETLELMTGDTFVTTNGIQNIHLLKVDTEGHELEVLEGFMETFRKGLIQSVLIEVGFGSDEIHGQFQEINEFLVRQKMVLCGFYDTDFTADSTTNYSNAVYCQSRHLLPGPTAY